MQTARNIGTLPAPQTAEAAPQVQWTAPNYPLPEQISFKERPAARQELSQTAPKLSRSDLERTADQVYRMIEDRVRRERRRLGL